MKDKKLNDSTNHKALEKDKLELIKLRIKNNFYKNENVLERVVEEIVKRELKDK